MGRPLEPRKIAPRTMKPRTTTSTTGLSVPMPEEYDMSPEACQLRQAQAQAAYKNERKNKSRIPSPELSVEEASRKKYRCELTRILSDLLSRLDPQEDDLAKVPPEDLAQAWETAEWKTYEESAMYGGKDYDEAMEKWRADLEIWGKLWEEEGKDTFRSFFFQNFGGMFKGVMDGFDEEALERMLIGEEDEWEIRETEKVEQGGPTTRSSDGSSNASENLNIEEFRSAFEDDVRNTFDRLNNALPVGENLDSWRMETAEVDSCAESLADTTLERSRLIQSENDDITHDGRRYQEEVRVISQELKECEDLNADGYLRWRIFLSTHFSLRFEDPRKPKEEIVVSGHTAIQTPVSGRGYEKATQFQYFTANPSVQQSPSANSRRAAPNPISTNSAPSYAPAPLSSKRQSENLSHEQLEHSLFPAIIPKTKKRGAIEASSGSKLAEQQQQFKQGAYATQPVTPTGITSSASGIFQGPSNIHAVPSEQRTDESTNSSLGATEANVTRPVDMNGFNSPFLNFKIPQFPAPPPPPQAEFQPAHLFGNTSAPSFPGVQPKEQESPSTRAALSNAELNGLIEKFRDLELKVSNFEQRQATELQAAHSRQKALLDEAKQQYAAELRAASEQILELKRDQQDVIQEVNKNRGDLLEQQQALQAQHQEILELRKIQQEEVEELNRNRNELQRQWQEIQTQHQDILDLKRSNQELLKQQEDDHEEILKVRSRQQEEIQELRENRDELLRQQQALRNQHEEIQELTKSNLELITKQQDLQAKLSTGAALSKKKIIHHVSPDPEPAGNSHGSLSEEPGAETTITLTTTLPDISILLPRNYSHLPLSLQNTIALFFNSLSILTEHSSQEDITLACKILYLFHGIIATRQNLTCVPQTVQAVKDIITQHEQKQHQSSDKCAKKANAVLDKCHDGITEYFDYIHKLLLSVPQPNEAWGRVTDEAEEEVIELWGELNGVGERFGWGKNVPARGSAEEKKSTGEGDKSRERKK